MPPPSAPNKTDTSQVPAVPDAGVPYAWVVVVLLVPVVLLNYLDRQMLATMRAAMVADLPDLTRKEDWGMALACFKWTYALMSPFGGMLADRVNKRHLIPLSLCAWSAVTWWTGHVTSFEELLLARAVMGASEAFYMPTALALIGEMHAPGNRSKAVGLHQTGLYLGQILGGFAGYAAESPSLGWRWAFDKAGLVGLLYALPLVWILRKTQPQSTEASAPTDDGIASQRAPFSDWLPLLRNRNFLLLAAYFTLPAIAAWVVRDWMPDILRERFGLGQGQASVSAILYLQIASVAGAIGGGILADRWETHSVRGRLYASALGTLLFLPALFSVGNAPTLSIAIGGLLLFGFGWGAFDSNNMPILCQVVSPERRATAYGLMNMVSLMCGGIGDWLFGFLRDRHVSLQSIFGVFAGVALLSIGFVLLIRPDKRTAESRA